MIQVVPYRPSWPTDFCELSSSIRAALGPLALRIDHIGSTSVRGLVAKDVIDIQITVERLEDAIERGLNEVGYVRLGDDRQDHVPPGVPGGQADSQEWKKWLFKEREGRRANVHVRVAGRANQRYPLLFRDYLRAHQPACEAYAQVKLALARLHGDDVEAYYDVKDPVCDIIMSAAEEWAVASGWEQGAPDA